MSSNQKSILKTQNKSIKQSTNNKNYGSTGNLSDASSSSSISFQLNQPPSPPLLSWSRLWRMFNLEKVSGYLLVTAILGLVIFVISVSSFILGVTKVIAPPHRSHPRPHPQPHQPKHPNPTEVFLEFPKADSIRNNLKLITGGTHIAGKNESYANWIQEQFEQYGLKSEKVTYYPYLNYPKFRKLAILDPPGLRYEAKLREDAVDGDDTSRDQDASPTFHGYSADGNVTARLVYANYGTVEDFESLEKSGISVQGRIVLVRYGKNFRGLKVMAAQKYGAVGVIIYSDPADDGYVRGPTYPEGPWRSASSVQRGSVSFLSIHPGDPLTPGTPATSQADRLDPQEATSLPKIPSLPISYEDALPLIKLLNGRGKKATKFGAEWQGGLNETYFVGPSKGHVNLVNKVTAQVAPIWNVFATIPGTDLSEKAVIIGNHRDAWVYGASDPGVGTATLLEVARTFGHLLKTGWKPRRTIMLGSWDGEEYSLLGSTEWCEDRSQWLQENAVTYINVDGFSGNQFTAMGTPSLNQFIQSVTHKIADPTNSTRTLLDNWSDQTPDDVAPTLGDLGSGSDFTGFYQHLGVPSVHFEFSGDSGVYHSNYDSFNWYEKFGDPDFSSSVAMARLVGISATELADADLLPIRLQDYSLRLGREIDGLSGTHAKKGIDFLPLHSALDHLNTQVAQFNQHLTPLRNIQTLNHTDAKSVAIVNTKLARFEQRLLDPEGLPKRPWYKHVVFAPGLWKGYESQAFPGIWETLQEGEVPLAQTLVHRYSTIIRNAADYLLTDIKL